MFRMEIDSSPQSNSLTPRDRILQRLDSLGVPAENLEQLQPGLVAYVKNNKSQIGELVSALLPTNEEAMEAITEQHVESPKSTGSSSVNNVEELFHESMIWLQWLMFDGKPSRALEQLADTGQRGVCGAVWGSNDIAYRCRTCEHDPTCAICVPCFQNGNHKDHDYSIIYTGGGCCDCGDVTAWKRQGFCSKHKGAEQIQPLPEEYANSLGPVLDVLLSCWRKRLLFPESNSQKSLRGNNGHTTELKMVTDELTSAVVNMLLKFCKHSESLLSFISRKVSSSAGLLDILVRAERFIITGSNVKKIHELLLKLLGEPQFKYEFAKVFLSYYPTVVNEAIRECNDTVFNKYPLLSIFSVQIFTVPTLTPRLVKEMNLLAMLLGCLGDIFLSCAGGDGVLQVAKWGNLYETTIRVVEDIRFVMSHSSVPRHVTRDRRDILGTWLNLLAFVQGTNQQKRETGIHVLEEGDFMHLPFVLGHSIANIHALLVGGAFSTSSADDADDVFNTLKAEDFEDQDSHRLAKVGRLSQESSVCSMTGRSPLVQGVKSDSFPVPSSVLCLISECLRAIENWLVTDNTSGPLPHILCPKTNSTPSSVLKRTLSKFRRGREIFKPQSPPSPTKQYSCPSQNGGTALDSSQEPVYESRLEGNHAPELEALRLLSLSDWPDIVYKVSLQKISVHIPLHRLLSMALQRALGKCYGETAQPDGSSGNYDFFGLILGGYHPYGFSAFIMEHALRIRVFCAQVHAGMWRKNGDSAISSCEWYRSVRWSEQGLELDLFLLQCCAALAPADLYISRILERFELSNYLSFNLERSSEYEPALVQEMLTLIIQIVKERRFCGLTLSECLQRELVYRLSISDATHSQLVKSLPRDLSKNDKLQEVLDRIAIYSNPSGMNQGMYKLRSPYWQELDLYHPRWNSRDLQVAEERYMRFCNASSLTTQLPIWSKIFPPLGRIAQVATCRTLLQIVRAVLLYAVFSDNPNASRAPDGVLLTALHLLSLSLDICESGYQSCYEGGDVIPLLALASEEISVGNYGDQSLLSLLVFLMRKHKRENNFVVEGEISNLSCLIESLLKKFAKLQPGCMIKLQDLAPEVVFQLSPSFPSADSNSVRSASDSDKRKAKARERQAAILEKMKAQQSKFLASIGSTPEASTDDSKHSSELCDSDVRPKSEEEAIPVICSLCHDTNCKSPLAYLVFLQKSRLLSFTNRGPPSWDQTRCSGNEPASERSEDDLLRSSEIISSSQLMQLIGKSVNEFALEGQPKEVEAFLEYVKAKFPSVKSTQPRCKASIVKKERRRASSFEILEDQMYSLIREEIDVNSWHWDLLKNDKKLSALGGRGSGTAKSLLLWKYISSLSTEYCPSTSTGNSTDKARSSELSVPLPAYNGFGPSDCDGIYLSSCGHAVHQGCLDRYLSSVKERYSRRMVVEGSHIVDPDQGEFLCPVCRGLANSVLPAAPADTIKSKPLVSNDTPSGAIVPLTLRFQDAIFLLQSAADVSGSREILQSLPLQQFGPFRVNVESVVGVLCRMYFPDKDKDKISESGRLSHSLILYDMLKYSLVSTEIAARSGNTSLTPNYSLGALYKELKSSNGFILSLLLNIVQTTRTNSSLNVLLRLRGVQLFSDSIYSGNTADELSGSPFVGGSVQEILELSDTEIQYPDIQFWKRASDPVLAHDAFSSLMWTLYCLPSPFLSCEESFLSLVHLFYVVTLTQTIITYFQKCRSSLTELGCSDSLLTDIYRIAGEYGVAHKYFDSNHHLETCDIKDAIRSLSFPYLRRCALLWKLIRSSISVPFSSSSDGNDNILSGLSSYSIGETGETTAVEFTEVEKLEKIFKIPSLDDILKDSVVRFVVPRWLHRFSQQFETRSLNGVLYSAPATPFKLMNLPHLYQDLLQRYIKQHCPECGVVPEEPMLCLLCGKLCSQNWKTCCRESVCQTHATLCGGGTGVFLFIRKTTIWLQSCSARQALWPSPYLDAFGEEDIEMNRGKPLYLNEERYAALTHLVASHGLDRSSRVLRQATTGHALLML